LYELAPVAVTEVPKRKKLGDYYAGLAAKAVAP
jgi:hypothetical protein